MKQRECLLAYLAGLFDGEGTVSLAKPSNKNAFRTPILSISSTDLELVEIAVEIARGGWVQVKKRQPKTGHRQAFEFRIKNNAAISLAEEILPYVRCPAKVKRLKMLVHEYPLVTKRNGKYSLTERLAKKHFENRFMDEAG